MQESHWYVLIVSSNREQATVEKLNQRGFNAYSPMIWRRTRLSRGQHGEIQRAMFVSYAFLEFEAGNERWREAEEIPGVWRFLKTRQRGAWEETPAQLPGEALAAIQSKAFELEKRWMGRKNQKPVGFEVGQRVMVKVGYYADLLVNIEKFDDRGRAIILLDMLGSKREVAIDRAELVAA